MDKDGEEAKKKNAKEVKQENILKEQDENIFMQMKTPFSSLINVIQVKKI